MSSRGGGCAGRCPGPLRSPSPRRPALSEVLTTGVAGNWRVALYCGVAWLVTGAAAGSLVSSVGQRITVRPVTGVGPNVLAGLLLGVMFGFGMSALSQLFEQGLGLAAAVGYGIVFGAGLGLVAGIVGLRDGPLSASLRLPGRDHLAGAVCCGVATWAAFSDTLGTTQAILVGASNGIAFALAVGWTRPSERPRAPTTPQSSHRNDFRAGGLFAVIGGAGIAVGVAFAVSTLTGHDGDDRGCPCRCHHVRPHRSHRRGPVVRARDRRRRASRARPSARPVYALPRASPDRRDLSPGRNLLPVQSRRAPGVPGGAVVDGAGGTPAGGTRTGRRFDR